MIVEGRNGLEHGRIEDAQRLNQDTAVRLLSGAPLAEAEVSASSTKAAQASELANIIPTPRALACEAGAGPNSERRRSARRSG